MPPRGLKVTRSFCGAAGARGHRLREAVSASARRALHNRRLAYAMIAEPVEAAVDDARLEWRRRIGEALAGLIAEGVAQGAFRPVDPQLAAACVVGAFMEALVGPLTPATLLDDDNKLAADIAGLCLAIVEAPDPTEEAPKEEAR